MEPEIVEILIGKKPFTNAQRLVRRPQLWEDGIQFEGHNVRHELCRAIARHYGIDTAPIDALCVKQGVLQDDQAYQRLATLREKEQRKMDREEARRQKLREQAERDQQKAREKEEARLAKLDTEAKENRLKERERAKKRKAEQIAAHKERTGPEKRKLATVKGLSSYATRAELRVLKVTTEPWAKQQAALITLLRKRKKEASLTPAELERAKEERRLKKAVARAAWTPEYRAKRLAEVRDYKRAQKEAAQ